MSLFAFAKNNLRFLLVLAIGSALLIGCIGFSHTNVANNSGTHTTSNCPLMPGMQSLCQMDPLEHIAAWQDMFAALPGQLGLFGTLLLLIASFLVSRYVKFIKVHIPLFVHPPSQFLYSKRYIPIVSPLQEAFSNGILHPKIF